MWFGSFPKLEPNWGNLNGNSIVDAGGLEQICLGIPKGAHSSLSKESGVWQGVLYDVDCAQSNLENNNTFKIFTTVESVYILVGVFSSILNDTCGETFDFLAKPLGPAASDKRQKFFSILYDSLTVGENKFWYVLASQEPLQQPLFLLRLQHWLQCLACLTSKLCGRDKLGIMFWSSIMIHQSLTHSFENILIFKRKLCNRVSRFIFGFDNCFTG